MDKDSVQNYGRALMIMGGAIIALMAVRIGLDLQHLNNQKDQVQLALQQVLSNNFLDKQRMAEKNNELNDKVRDFEREMLRLSQERQKLVAYIKRMQGASSQKSGGEKNINPQNIQDKKAKNKLVTKSH